MEDRHLPQQARLDAWLRVYEGQIAHARHHENLRTQSTNMIVAITAALVAFLASSLSTSPTKTTAVASMIFLLNVFGALMSWKHYERSKLHISTAGKYREVISELLSHEGVSPDDRRKAAHEEHRPFLLSEFRAYWFWIGLHLLLAVSGLYFIY